jgi:hypothetical protein
MVSFEGVRRRIAIEPEEEPVIVDRDGKVRNATAEDIAHPDGQLIVAEKDMLPVAWDSPLRTWGFYSMAGYCKFQLFIRQCSLSSLLNRLRFS